MTQGSESRYDTWSFLFRKKVKKLSALALVVGSVIWRPKPNQTLVLLHAFYRKRTITGTVTDDPAFKLTNGTTDIVAVVDLVNTNDYQRLAVAGHAVFDYNNPLTLVISDAPAGATVWDYDLVLVAAKLSD